MSIMNPILSSLWKAGALLLALIVAQPFSGRANVYATNIKLNGSKNSITSPQGRLIDIGYILNEPATAGVTIEIFSGTNLVRALSMEAGQNGTLRGENIVAWDSRSQTGELVPEGDYSVRVTAAAVGHEGWTMISTDHRTNNYVFRGTGIAVNQNANSPFYGRVYIANADSGPNAGFPGAKPGEFNGILQFNADGSLPEEGAVAVQEGWSGFGESPWRVEVSAEGDVFGNDLFYGGEVFRWDPAFEPGSRVHVLAGGNLPSSSARLSGMAVSDYGTNSFLYMADSAESSSGLLRYSLNASGQVPAGNAGVTVVGITNQPDALNIAPYDVAVDNDGNAYVIQYRFAAGDSSPRVLKFALPAPDGPNPAPILEALWAVGQGDDTMGRASGVAVDPTGEFVAVAFRGITGPEFEWINGGTGIFAASNGVLVTNLDLGIEIGGELTHQDTDVAWDAVGNVYFIDDYVQLWRTFSPPGPNEATTLALYTIQIIPGVIQEPPQIGSIKVDAAAVTIQFTGTVGVPATSFQVLGAATASGPYNPVSATVTAGPVPGQYVATVPVSGATSFYRILEGEAPPPGENPVLTSVAVNGGIVNLVFTGAPSDSPASFIVLSSPTANGTYAEAAGASVTEEAAPGVFRASVPVNGPTQFYRIRK